MPAPPLLLLGSIPLILELQMMKAGGVRANSGKHQLFTHLNVELGFKVLQLEVNSSDCECPTAVLLIKELRGINFNSIVIVSSEDCAFFVVLHSERWNA